MSSAHDEIGYLSYDSRYADLLFEVVRRYDAQKPLLLGTKWRPSRRESSGSWSSS